MSDYSLVFDGRNLAYQELLVRRGAYLQLRQWTTSTADQCRPFRASTSLAVLGVYIYVI